MANWYTTSDTWFSANEVGAWTPTTTATALHGPTAIVSKSASLKPLKQQPPTLKTFPEAKQPSKTKKNYWKWDSCTSSNGRCQISCTTIKCSHSSGCLGRLHCYGRSASENNFSVQSASTFFARIYWRLGFYDISHKIGKRRRRWIQ